MDVAPLQPSDVVEAVIDERIKTYRAKLANENPPEDDQYAMRFAIEALEGVKTNLRAKAALSTQQGHNVPAFDSTLIKRAREPFTYKINGVIDRKAYADLIVWLKEKYNLMQELADALEAVKGK